MLQPYPAFDCSAEGRAVRWQKWVSRLKNYFIAYKITEDLQRKSLLLTFGGDDLNDIVDTFSEEDLRPGENVTHFDKLCSVITTYFNPEQNAEFQKYIFRHTEQMSDNIDEFYSHLLHIASTCGFTDMNSEIKSQLIAGCKSHKVREKGLANPKLTLTELLTYARTLQLTTTQSQAMAAGAAEVNRLQRSNYYQQRSRPPQHEAQQSSRRSCNNCGGEWPHKGGRASCPAFNKQCSTCKKMNHFARVCRSSQRLLSQPTHAQTSVPPPAASGVHTVNDTQASTQQDDAAGMSHYVFATCSKGLPVFDITVNGKALHFLADSGASVNLLSESDFHTLNPLPELKPSSNRITAYGSRSPLPVLGTFDADLTYENTTITAPICVVSGCERPILSWDACKALKILTTVNHVKTLQEELKTEFPCLFNGLGNLNDRKIKLHIDRDVQPVAQHYRRVPFHVREHIEDQLKHDEEAGIIEKATGPTPWVSPVVVVPKPKQPGKVRLCVDMRAANKAIKRERHATPTLDELKTMLSGAKVFSKLDLNQGYNQLELDEESRYITTFATHLGLYRYKRLFFGVNSASEIFQEAIRQALSGINGVVNVSDDILCYGTSQGDHDANLRALFQRLQEKGLTLNADKCVYNRKSLEFLGHVFGEDGIKPSQDKLKAIIDLPTPANASEVRSLLGMMNFCGAQHIPNYATLTHDLRQLTKKTTPWSWTAKHETALTTLKLELSKATTLAYFNPNTPVEIYTDGSPVGVSAVLTQEGRIIQFASRALTQTEQRYSQTEREALAITWACEYFHIYIFGAPFSVYTDHKPLISMFNNPRAQVSARIERWIMRMQPYEVTVQYRPGNDNPADYLSRHPVSQFPGDREEKIAEEYVNYVTQTSTPKAMTCDEVATETTKDATLTAVINAILTNQWFVKDSDVDVKTFQVLHQCCAELSLAHDARILLKGRQIVLPASLHQKAVAIAHSGHQGIVKTLALMREKVWFYGMQRFVEHTVKTCMTCQVATPTTTREPLQMSDLPNAPWTELSCDFGHLPNGQYILVVTDEYSRYPVVEILDSTAAVAVIPRLDRIFAEFGIPESLKSDNGPPFNSHEFAQYCQHMGIRHRKITPLWPRANAETERFMRTIKKVIKGSTVPNFRQTMYRFLFDYRTTPHCTTGVPPATVLFGRSLKTKLPELPAERQGDHGMRLRDGRQKASMKQYADNRANVKPSTLTVGDAVLVKNPKPTKAETPFEPIPLVVTQKKGSMITARRGPQTVTRNSSFFKKSPRPPTTAETVPDCFEPEPEPPCSPSPHAHTTPGNHTQPDTVPLRRSNRETKMPSRFDDFVLIK